jgi:Dolichyl-phosphate-mannose-protein mannosyltransferase
MRGRAFPIALLVALGLGLGLRLAILASPLGEIDGDEAVVGLMARHIAFQAEMPVFYYGQPYLGSLEAFSAAPWFRVFDSSTLLLKLVPTVYSLGFLVLSAFLARRLFGTPVAVATAAYLALPPAMWAVWSTKARGGYAELLFLGEALLLATLSLAACPNRRRAILWGVLGGLAFWTHLLAVVYLVPAVLYLALARRWRSAHVAAAAAGAITGMLPLILGNLASGFRTVTAMTQPSDLPVDMADQFVRFFRISLPILLGLGQPSSSETLFNNDWGLRPASHGWLVLLMLAGLGAVLALHAPSLRNLVDRNLARAEPALLLLIGVVVPPIIALSRFGFFVSEPRYALPIYACLPLLFAAVWRLRIPDLTRWLAVAGVLAFNVWSLISTDVRLWQPEETPNNTVGTRADLVRYLVAQDRHQMYTDYWIGYPIMFETRETVLAYVISGGFNRYIPPADNVQRTPNPAWVFAPDTDAERTFLDSLASAGGQAHVAQIASYRVYTDVQPLAALRPPR